MEARLEQADHLAREAREIGRGRPISPDSLEPGVQASRELPGRQEQQAERRPTSSPGPVVVAPHYAYLRERILTQIPRDRSAALLFVHPGDVEGVPTTVAELAVAMTEAMSGDILAIDANVGPREGTGGSGGGLMDVLVEKSEWYTAVLPTRNPHVVLLPGGTWPAGTKWPDDACVRRLVDQLKARFEMVLIDGGSIDNSMTKILAHCCDACYVVLALAQTRQRAVSSTFKRLRQAGGRVSGCILIGATAAEAESARS
jgi:Mrp family chromosome partitioning ATPase